MTTFSSYGQLPEPIRNALAALEEFIGDMDGKTVGTATDDNTFIDEGTIDAEDAVKAFNIVVAAFSPALRSDDA